MSHPPRGYYCVPGMSPDGGETWEFLISVRMLQHLERSGPGQKFYDARLLGGLLESPLAVFQGLNREDYEEAHCYSGIPACRWKSSSIQVPPPRGFVFLAFVNSDLRGHIVLDWEWRPAHKDRAGHPIGCESDFGRQTWPKTS